MPRPRLPNPESNQLANYLLDHAPDLIARARSTYPDYSPGLAVQEYIWDHLIDLTGLPLDCTGSREEPDLSSRLDWFYWMVVTDFMGRVDMAKVARLVIAASK